MKELISKFSKYSATQLINKMEKGVISEEEKNVIITLLRNRGKDVTPYFDKTVEEIKEDSKLDEVTRKPNKIKSLVDDSLRPKKEKIQKESSVKVKKDSKTKRVRVEHELFSVGVLVTTDVASGRFAVGQKAVVKSTFELENNPGEIFATLKTDKADFLARKINSLKLA